MDVSQTGSVGGAGPIRPVHLAPAEAAPATSLGGLEAPQDEVDISSAARMLDQLQHDPLVRAERLTEIRTAIAAGTYETPEKLEAAVNRLLDKLNRGAL